MNAHHSTITLASLAVRLASLFYEGLLVLSLLSLTFLLPYLLLGVFFHIGVAGWIEWVHLYSITGMYFLWCWLRSGQTLAMKTWRLLVVDAKTRQHITRQQAFVRYTLAWPSIGFFGIGLLWALLDNDRQFLHDRLAGTCVVRLPRPEGVSE